MSVYPSLPLGIFWNVNNNYYCEVYFSSGCRKEGQDGLTNHETNSTLSLSTLKMNLFTFPPNYSFRNVKFSYSLELLSFFIIVNAVYQKRIIRYIFVVPLELKIGGCVSYYYDSDDLMWLKTRMMKLWASMLEYYFTLRDPTIIQFAGGLSGQISR